MTIIFISKHGTKIGKHQQRITLSNYVDGTFQEEIPTTNLEEIIIEANVSISTQAIKLLANQGVPVLFLERNSPVAILHPEIAHGTVEVRRQQLLAYYDKRGVEFANQIVKAGIKNKVILIKKTTKRRNLNQKAIEKINFSIQKIEKLIQKLPVKASQISLAREVLFGIEGEAAKNYFQAFKEILDHEWKFEGRNRRPPKDPINSMLSYGYAILYSKIFSATIIAGLEPFAGFLHTDKSGKPSLALDLIEEFRQAIVDKVILKITGKKLLTPEDFEVTNKGCLLSQKAKKTLAEQIYNELERKILTPNGKLSIKDVFVLQARKAGKFFRRLTTSYHPYIIQ